MDVKIGEFEELQTSIAQQKTRLEVAVSKHNSLFHTKVMYAESLV